MIVTYTTERIIYCHTKAVLQIDIRGLHICHFCRTQSTSDCNTRYGTILL